MKTANVYPACEELGCEVMDHDTAYKFFGRRCGQRRLKWDDIPEHDMSESNVEEWREISVGRRGTDSILAIGYDMRNRAEIEQWADDYGFAVDWR